MRWIFLLIIIVGLSTVQCSKSVNEPGIDDPNGLRASKISGDLTMPGEKFTPRYGLFTETEGAFTDPDTGGPTHRAVSFFLFEDIPGETLLVGSVPILTKGYLFMILYSPLPGDFQEGEYESYLDLTDRGEGIKGNRILLGATVAIDKNGDGEVDSDQDYTFSGDNGTVRVTRKSAQNFELAFDLEDDNGQKMTGTVSGNFAKVD